MARGGFFSVDALRGVHVLVVEPDDETRALWQSILEYCGALVTAVASPEQALDVMRQLKADVLVSDLTMAGNDGFWLIRQVRALKPDDGGVVTAIAVGPSASDQDRALASGFDAYLPKPLDPWALCRAISNLTSAS